MAIAHSTNGTLLEETAATHEIATTGNSGEFMLMVAGTANDELLTNSETGWTKIIETQGISGGDRSLAAWWKIHTGAEPGTYTVSHPTSLLTKGAIVTYTGVDATTPMDAAATAGPDQLDSDTHTPASITTVTDQAFCFTSVWKDGGATAPGDEPTGSTARVENSGTNKYFGIADQGPLSIGAFQFNDWSGMGANADSISITIALRPATAGLPSFHGARRGIARGVARGIG